MAENEISIKKDHTETINVFVDDCQTRLKPSLKVWNHSPSGFNVGYMGSGPAQTALAILMQFTDNQTAVRLHQKFKSEFVAFWEVGEVYLLDIQEWIDQNE